MCNLRKNSSLQQLINTWQFDFPPLGVQKAALEATGTQSHIAWFIEQGLGKSHLTLSDYLFRYNNGLNDFLCIFCPNSLKYDWQKKMESVGFDKLFDIQIWPKIDKDITDWKNKVLIINYEATIGKGFKFLQSTLRYYKTYIVFDESGGYIVNPNNKRTNNSIHMAGESKAVRLLTGTPAPNGPHELYGQLRCVNVRVGPSATEFKYAFCQIEYRNVGKIKVQSVTGAKNEKQLARLIGDRVFYAKKSEWAPYLPKKMYIPIHIEMTEEQNRVYKNIVEDLVTQIDNKVISVKSAVGSISKLQQISSGYILDENGTPSILSDYNPKIEAIREIIKGTQSKVIIFGFYQVTMKLLIESFPSSCKILSKHHMTDETIEEEKSLFNTNNDVQVMIIQQEVGKYGHTLLGTKERPCDTTIYAENRYSLISRLQSEDRNNREGAHENHKINSYYDIISSVIDQRVLDRLLNKKEIAEDLINELRTYLEG